VTIYSCLGVLQVCALYFAFQIRKVKVKGLNDAKYTAITVYGTTIAIILSVITTFTLSTYITACVCRHLWHLHLGNSNYSPGSPVHTKGNLKYAYYIICSYFSTVRMRKHMCSYAYRY
jgi:hypothetical protein